MVPMVSYMYDNIKYIYSFCFSILQDIGNLRQSNAELTNQRQVDLVFAYFILFFNL